ncbi:MULTISPECIES: DUF1156 domain-containing protein [Pseudonocardia]|nr:MULTISPECIES: DUF1156 domain-containing protein [Pseudonocardia]
MKRKLIEVALPLEVINRESAREKSIRRGHPSTFHLWWARRPLAAARAVLFAQLVDDPSSHPERFPSDADLINERKRLHRLIERMVTWENLHDDEVFMQARQEILDSTDGAPPPILDLFAGGGAIPLEAQRLGLEAHASDLNPVAVLINKALIEIPPKFAGRSPVNPEASVLRQGSWPSNTGLADDVQFYGNWIRDEAEKRIGSNYPKATLSDGSKASVIAWIWARTVTCPNPACGIRMPLVRSWQIGGKKGREAWVIPSTVNGIVTYRISYTSPSPNGSTTADSGTVTRTGATCINCSAAVDLKYIRAEGKAGRLGTDLLSIVAEGKRTRHYLPPSTEQIEAASLARPEDAPDGRLGYDPRAITAPNYGLETISDLFTARQLVALTTFSDLVVEARERVYSDAIARCDSTAERSETEKWSASYADAVALYLGAAVSRGADLNNSLVTWSSSRDQARNLFARQAIPMTWDFVEVSPFGGAAGDLGVALRTSGEAFAALPGGEPGTVSQLDAQTRQLQGLLISTDPPYYDNIGYSDLSDFFYVWLRRALRTIHPELLSTLLTPKENELVANPYRHDGKSGAHQFFESGFNGIFRRAREHAIPNFPITVYYAFKQVETNMHGEASTGWETLLDGMLSAGWSITATWPMRSERGGRMRDIGSNALASSIVLALRPRPASASQTPRRGFISALKGELPQALRELQQGAIAPVDLPQAAIGPGMAVFSRYSAVLNDDGSPMSVRAALSLINEVLDEVLSEQEGDFDSDTRFALAWFRQHGFEAGDFGDADNLARARNASLEHLERSGILSLRGTRGKVSLLAPATLDPAWNPQTDAYISVWEVVMHLSRTLTESGIVATSSLLSEVPDSIDRDLCKELGFLLFALAEDSKRTKVAIEFNALGTAWNDIVSGVVRPSKQGTFDYTRG